MLYTYIINSNGDILEQNINPTHLLYDDISVLVISIMAFMKKR